MDGYPSATSLRRCWPWQSWAHAGGGLERVAHHEAAHVVVLEHFGVEGMAAKASECFGEAVLPVGFLADRADPAPDESGVLTATAAAILVAGFEGERLYRGEPWHGPTWAPTQADFQAAESLLSAKFGRLSSAAHGFAARTARAILIERKERFEQIAKALIERGEWADQEGAA